MTKRKDSKKMILDHSQAKITLLKEYLSVYLNILHRASSIDNIYLYDLFAGEGIYKNKRKGSALTILQVIEDHYYLNERSCPQIYVHINEPGHSEIEIGISKIERIKREAEKIYNPNSVDRKFTQLTYKEIIIKIISEINNLDRNERGLIFIDPWGYSQVQFQELLSLMKSGRVELILFLPIYFMYRFAEKSLSDDEFPSGEKLEILLKEIFNNDQPNLTNQEEFISSIKEAFRNRKICKYVDTFVIERSKGNLFSLFFFTNHPKGAEKMLAAKWSLDDSRGKGFRSESGANQLTIFKGIEGSNFRDILLDYIIKEENPSNFDIYEFGLRKGFLPKHSNEVLTNLKKEKIVDSRAKDGKPVKGNYIGNPDRQVEFFKLK